MRSTNSAPKKRSSVVWSNQTQFIVVNKMQQSMSYTVKQLYVLMAVFYF